MGDDTDSNASTNRRTVLNTVAAGTIASTVFAGAASAAKAPTDGAGAGPEYCEKEVYQYQCVDSNCDCACSDCDCNTKQQKRSCCEDPYGNIISCGGWYDTGYCCSSC